MIIKPAGLDKHRVELHLRPTFGGPDTNRVIYVTDEVPAEDEAAFDVVKKSLCSWASCCFGLSEVSGHGVGDDANDAAHDNPNDAGQPVSVADDEASQRSRKTKRVHSAANVDAPLPPSHLIIETVNELKRVLDSAKEQQKQSDYAVAKIAESSVGVPNPPSVDRSLTKAGIVLPDVARPKGPNSVRPRLPASLTASLSLPSDASSFADESDVSPWGALAAIEGGGSERAAQNRFASNVSIADRLSAIGGSLRGGSLAGNAFVAVGTGSISSLSHSVASEFARPVFHRRAPTAARNSPAAVAAEPTALTNAAVAAVARPPVVLPPVMAFSAPLALRPEMFFVPPAPTSSASITPTTSSLLASTPRASVPSPIVSAPQRNLPYAASTNEAAAAPFASAAVERQDASHELRAWRLSAEPSESLVSQPPTAPGHSSAPVHVTSTPLMHRPSVSSQAVAASSSYAQDAASVPGVRLPPHDTSLTQHVPHAPLPGVASDIAMLERILSNVSATDLLSRFINDGVDDGDLGALAVTKPAKLMAKYGLHESQLSAFIAECRQASSAEHEALVHSQSALRDQRFQQAPVDDVSPSGSERLSAANFHAPAPQQQPAARPADTHASRARPPLPPLPTSFEK